MCCGKKAKRIDFSGSSSPVCRNGMEPDGRCLLCADGVQLSAYSTAYPASGMACTGEGKGAGRTERESVEQENVRAEFYSVFDSSGIPEYQL